MKNDQFAVYRVNRNSEGRDLWHLSYQEAVSRKLAIRIEHYRQMDIRPLLPGENAIALWKRMKESCEVSDVIVLNQNGEIHCYYVNEDYPQLLSGFIRLNPSGTLVTLDTENYRIHIVSGKGNYISDNHIVATTEATDEQTKASDSCFSAQVDALTTTDKLVALDVTAVLVEKESVQNTILDSGSEGQVIIDRTVNAFRATPVPGV